MSNPEAFHDSIKQLTSADEATRVAAAESLAQSSSHAGEVMVALVDAAADGSESVREWASSALESAEDTTYTPNDARALALRLANPRTAYWSATLLGRMFEEDPDAATAEITGALCSLMTNTELELAARERAAWALGRAGKILNDASVRTSLSAIAQSGAGRLARLAQEILDKQHD